MKNCPGKSWAVFVTFWSKIYGVELFEKNLMSANIILFRIRKQNS